MLMVCFVCRGVLLTPEGNISEGALRRNLQRSPSPAALLLGTELPAASYGTYDLVAGADALQALPANSGDERAAHVSTTGFPPTELTLLHLHRVLARDFPDIFCARWTGWQLDTPTPPALAELEGGGCSMSLRFLHHFLDAQPSTAVPVD